MTYQEKISAAMEAIRRVFADTKPSAEETREALEKLKEEIESMIDSLP